MKKYKFLIIYAIVIIIILIAIMFIIPDSVYLKKYENIELPTTEVEVKEYPDFEKQKEHLLNKNYEYEYLILDSMGTETYEYDCNGKIDGDIESGTCTKPEKISYTESTKKDVFHTDLDFLDVSYIFNLINDQEPEKEEYNDIRIFKYTADIKLLETEINITTDKDEITKIELSNKYMTYILKFSNIIY